MVSVRRVASLVIVLGTHRVQLSRGQIYVSVTDWVVDDSRIPDVEIDCPVACEGPILTVDDAIACFSATSYQCTGSLKLHLQGTEDLTNLCSGGSTDATRHTFPIAPAQILAPLAPNVEVLEAFTGTGVVLNFTTNIEATCKLYIHEAPLLLSNEQSLNCGLDATINTTLPLEKYVVSMSQVSISAPWIYVLGPERMALVAQAPRDQCGSDVKQIAWDMDIQANWFLPLPPKQLGGENTSDAWLLRSFTIIVCTLLFCSLLV